MIREALWAREVRGVLVFDVKPFTSEVELKEKIQDRLKSGGLEWGESERQLPLPDVLSQ